MLFHPGLTVLIAVVLGRVAARPWDDGAFLSNSLLRGLSQDVIEDLAYGGENSLSEDESKFEDMPQAKRFSVNSFRLFRPFYHSRGNEQTLRHFHKRGSSSLNDLIKRLLALKGSVYGSGRTASMRFGPGGK